MRLPLPSLIFLLTHLYAINTIKNTTIRKKFIKDKVFQTYDLAVSLTLFKILIRSSADNSTSTHPLDLGKLD